MPIQRPMVFLRPNHHRHLRDPSHGVRALTKFLRRWEAKMLEIPTWRIIPVSK